MDKKSKLEQKLKDLKETILLNKGEHQAELLERYVELQEEYKINYGQRYK